MNNIQNDMQALLQKQMDRRDFLKHVGVGFVTLIGAATVFRAISSMNNGSHKATVGYSSGTYGGVTSPDKASKS